MRITKLQIAGFGQHENVTIDLQQQLHIFYGLNEAGKTTIQQFIMQILFGFPQKNHLERNYEPKNGGAYGGRIDFSDDEFGNYSVERTRGRAIGDVTVYMANGQQGDERLLTKLLRGYTKADIEAVFSFTLQQLQYLERMTEEQLNRTLLSSGTTGVDQFTAVDKQLSKEAAELYKKSGTKPLINSQLQKIQQQELELKKIRMQLADFEPKRQRMQQLTLESEETHKKQQEIAQQLDDATTYLRIRPLLERQQWITQQLGTQDRAQFPTQGINRFELLEKALDDKRLEAQQLQEKQQQLQLQVDTAVNREQLSALRQLHDADDEWRQWQLSEQQIEQQQKDLQQNFQMKQQLIGMTSPSYEAVLEMSSSLPTEAVSNELFKKLQKIEEKTNFLEGILQDLKQESSYKTQQLEQQKKAQDTPQRRSQKERVFSAPMIAAVIMACLSLFVVLFFKEWFGGIVGLAAAVALYLYSKRSTSHSQQDEERYMREQLNDLKRKEQDYKYQLAQQDNERDEVIAQLRVTLQQLSIYDDFDSMLYPELFRIVRELQQLALQGQQLFVQQNHLKNMIAERYEAGCQLLQVKPTKAQFSLMIAQQLHTLEDAQNRMTVTEEQLATVHEKIDYIQQEIAQLTTNKKTLLAAANSANQEEFYAMAERFSEQQTLLAEEQLIQQQLGDVSGLARYTVVEKEQLAAQLQNVKIISADILKELAMVRADIHHLAQDEHYSVAIVELEQSKAELAAYVKQWTIGQIAQAAINETLNDLQQQVLPKVIHRASENFAFLTSQRYERLQFSEGSFEVITQEGQHFSIGELSQATREQAYLALRFSLAEEKVATAPFPLIMDDPFVHFDTLRTAKVVQLLEKLQTKHQLLFFTCHQHMTEYFSEQNIIEVASLQMKGD